MTLSPASLSPLASLTDHNTNYLAADAAESTSLQGKAFPKAVSGGDSKHGSQVTGSERFALQPEIPF